MRTLKWNWVFIRSLKDVKKINIIFFTFVKDLTQSNHYKGTQEEQIVNQSRLDRGDGERCKKGLMTYTPQHIANFFLVKAMKEGSPMTQLKLIKLVYISYGWFLALTGEKLFNEKIQAWQHGPVIPSLYHEFKDFRKNTINRLSMNLDLDTWDEYSPEIDDTDINTKSILNTVWSCYKKFSGWDLREKTHEKGSPWDKVFVPETKGIEILDDDIGEHFKERIQEYLKAAKSN